MGDSENAALPQTVTCALCNRSVVRDRADVIDERVVACDGCIRATQEEPWPKGTALVWEGD